MEYGLEPIFNSESRVLILGSFPSVKSRGNFYYANPLNRFWKVMGEVLHAAAPLEPNDRRDWLLSHGVALWDLVKYCDIVGSSDSRVKITDVGQLNDIPWLIAQTKVQTVFCNGGKSHNLCKRYYPNIDAVQLPSTSPAYRAFEIDQWYAVSEALGC